MTGSTQRVLLTIRLTNANVQHENVPADSPQKPDLLQRSPTGTLPVLQTSQGYLSESHAICVYINDTANGTLMGSNALERAQVLQWGEFVTCEIQPNNTLTVYSLVGYYEYNQQTFNTALARVRTHLKTLNTALQGRTYLVGNSVTLADIELYMTLKFYYLLAFTEEDRKTFSNVTAWFTNIANHPTVVQVCGVSRFGRVTQKGPRKIEQPKPQQQKPAEKKAETKKEETKGGEEDEAPKSKKKHPLDDLPPSTFILDDFKRDFLNTPDKKGALERFWANYDANGYSLWFVHYQKLASEGKILFKTCNYYSMFLQKMENFRKYTFSAHGVYGTEGNFEIRGLWMWRGTDIAPQMKEHDAFDYHTFKRLDSSNENDRRIVEDYWLHVNAGDTCDGLPVQEVVYFR
jgi:elongation factor 1-gamma